MGGIRGIAGHRYGRDVLADALGGDDDDERRCDALRPAVDRVEGGGHTEADVSIEHTSGSPGSLCALSVAGCRPDGRIAMAL
ncbi:hypothetical protein ACWGIY_35305, partial [Streptomyces sp. NPDC054878]